MEFLISVLKERGSSSTCRSVTGSEEFRLLVLLVDLLHGEVGETGEAERWGHEASRLLEATDTVYRVVETM